MRLERNGKRIAIVLENYNDTVGMCNVLRYYTHRAYSVEESNTPMKMLLEELQKEITNV